MFFKKNIEINNKENNSLFDFLYMKLIDFEKTIDTLFCWLKIKEKYGNYNNIKMDKKIFHLTNEKIITLTFLPWGISIEQAKKLDFIGKVGIYIAFTTPLGFVNRDPNKTREIFLEFEKMIHKTMKNISNKYKNYNIQVISYSAGNGFGFYTANNFNVDKFISVCSGRTISFEIQESVVLKKIKEDLKEWIKSFLQTNLKQNSKEHLRKYLLSIYTKLDRHIKLSYKLKFLIKYDLENLIENPTDELCAMISDFIIDPKFEKFPLYNIKNLPKNTKVSLSKKDGHIPNKFILNLCKKLNKYRKIKNFESVYIRRYPFGHITGCLFNANYLDFENLVIFEKNKKYRIFEMRDNNTPFILKYTNLRKQLLYKERKIISFCLNQEFLKHKSYNLLYLFKVSCFSETKLIFSNKK